MEGYSTMVGFKTGDEIMDVSKTGNETVEVSKTGDEAN